MSDKQEDSFTESFDVLHKAQAKNAAYKDLVAFLEKYDKKITRQFNELSKRYKRLKDAGKRDMNYYKLFSQYTTLDYQTIEAKALRIEFLERFIEQNKQLEKAQSDFLEAYKQNHEGGADAIET